MRSRGQKWAVSGESRTTDNVAVASMYVVAGALEALVEQWEQPLTAPGYSALGLIVCAVSSSVAALIQESAHWRTAALVATARLLEGHIGLSAAAHVAAAAAREYGNGIHACARSPELLHIAQATRAAIETNQDAEVAAARRLIVRQISGLGASARLSCDAAGDQRYEALASDGATPALSPVEEISTAPVDFSRSLARDI